MPLRPDWSHFQPNPRFDDFRDRVGRLYRDGAEVGLVLVLTEPYARQVGGHLWWRRWREPVEILTVWTIVDGRFSDDVVFEDFPDEFRAADEELAAYRGNRLWHLGESLHVEWLDPHESTRLRKSEFGR